MLLVLSGIFSASETALFSLSKMQLRRLKKIQPGQCAVIENLLSSPRRTLNTILTGNMLVNVSASALVTETAIRISGQKALGIAVGFTTALLLIFGEVTPKTFAITHAEDFSCFIARYLQLFAKLIFPLRWLWAKIADFFSQRIIGRQYLKEPFLTEEEVRGLLSIGEKEGVVSKEEEQMISNVFDFAERSVNEVMTPRVDIIGVDFNEDAQQLERILKSNRHSKLPVYKETIDNILGIVYAKEYLLAPCPDWQKLVKPILFVPDTKKIEEVLLEFQSKRSYIAIVTDEYGGTSGLVTIEDILEEIVGEIQDEYDTEEKLIVRIDENSVSVSGKTSLHDLNEELHTHFKVEDVQTVAGLIGHLFGRIPKSGESIRHRNYLFTVDDVRKRRIRKITMTHEKHHYKHHSTQEKKAKPS
ncbi:MAG: HlyC/CorC family transporter [Candidatus Omnitrophica bacterium]|nr:HlyC/CorC family transporter [Candidatus Omnitrophota bacterium]